MRTWNGSIDIDGCLAEISLCITEPTMNNSGSWEGNGIVSKFINIEQYDTVIGTIIIDDITGIDKGFSFHFVGSEKPKV